MRNGNTILLFDINGTIIVKDKYTDLAFEKACNQFLNTENSLLGVNTTARSDKAVFKEALQNFGFRFQEKNWDDVLKIYKDYLEHYQCKNIWKANHDVVDFIKYVHQKGYFLALITGECSLGAEYKLRALDIWQYFVLGGFGEDGFERFEIGEKVFSRIKETNIEVEEIFMFGDTISDIETARHLGAKIISVHTKDEITHQLLKHNPDYLITYFEEIKTIF